MANTLLSYSLVEEKDIKIYDNNLSKFKVTKIERKIHISDTYGEFCKNKRRDK